MKQGRGWRAGNRGLAVAAVGSVTALCLLVARPAGADPAAPGVPDVGAAPVVAGGFQLPSGTASGLPGGTGTTVSSITQPNSLAQQIITLSAQVETYGQDLLKLNGQLAAAQQAAQAAEATLATATSDLADARQRADNEAADAYRAAAALGPLGGYASDLHQLSVLAPGIGAQPGGQASAHDVERAEQALAGATEAQQSAENTVADLTRQRDAKQAAYNRANASLTSLRSQSAYQQQLAAIDAQQAAIGAGLNVGAAANGLIPGLIAQKAVAAAETRLHMPYVWGAAGPNAFDCSGLVLWSYRQAGFNELPRVAVDQYSATRNSSVPLDQLVAGDLLFFATNPHDWRTIHHVAMYVGRHKDGTGPYMIEAPSTGDVVKEAPIWWSEFYGATRVVPATGKPQPTPGPPAGGGGGGTKPPPSPTPKPTPSTPSPTPPTTPPPSKSPTPSPTPAPTQSPTPSPSKSSPKPTPSTGSTAPSGGSTAPPGGGSSGASHGASNGSSAPAVGATVGSSSKAAG